MAQTFLHHGNYKLDRWDEQDRGFETPCWVWKLSLSSTGYAHAATTTAYRVVYEERHGPLVRGVELHHRCQTKACVNPDHLEPVTRAEHSRRHAKLTWSDVQRIRTGGERGIDLSREYGISEAHVSNIRAFRVWRA